MFRISQILLKEFHSHAIVTSRPSKFHTYSRVTNHFYNICCELLGMSGKRGSYFQCLLSDHQGSSWEGIEIERPTTMTITVNLARVKEPMFIKSCKIMLSIRRFPIHSLFVLISFGLSWSCPVSMLILRYRWSLTVQFLTCSWITIRSCQLQSDSFGKKTPRTFEKSKRDTAVQEGLLLRNV